MITIDTSTVTLDELEESILSIAHHMDQAMSKESYLHSSTSMYVNSKEKLGNKLDNITWQLATL